MPAEGTSRKHETIQDYKKLTNFENAKKVLENITLDLPQVPELKEIKKASFNRDKKIIEEIVKPKDELIQKLHTENVSLHKELSEQKKLVDMASDYEKNHTQMLVDNKNLKFRCRKLEL